MSIGDIALWDVRQNKTDPAKSSMMSLRNMINELIKIVGHGNTE